MLRWTASRLLLAALCSAGGWVRAAQTLPSVADTGVEQTLLRWTVVGPCLGRNPTEDPFGLNELSAFGEDPEGGAAILGKVLLAASPGFVRASGTGEFIDFQDLYGRSRIAEAPPSAAYAACRVIESRAVRRYILIGSSDREKVWLNGREIEASPDRHGLYQYTACVPAAFSAGSNLLVVKVVRYSLTWGLTVRLEPTAAAAAQAALEGQGMLDGLLLARSVLPLGAPLRLDPRGVPSDAPLKLSVIGPDGGVVLRESAVRGQAAWTPGPAAAPGLYRAIVDAGGPERYGESFLVGEADALAARTVAEARELPCADRERVLLDGLVRRIEVLLAPGNRRFSSPGPMRDWERKLVYTLRETSEAIALLRRGGDPLAGRPGLHLGAFRSHLDGSAQYYRLFVPPGTASDRPLPLAIVLPTTISAARPFLESAFMAAHSEAERMSVIAARHGMALLWCGYRAQPSGAPIDYEYFGEVLDAVAANVRLDPRRITLVGACSAGAIATGYVVRWPRRFAGVGLLNPVFRLQKIPSADRDRLFAAFPAYAEWKRSDNDVVDFLSLPQFPACVLHDGAEPGHGDLAISVAFADLARTMDFPLRFVRKSQGLSQHFSAWEDLIAWLSEQQVREPSAERAEQYFAPVGRVGPVADCFARPFVVVYGTAGSARDRAGCLRLARAIGRQWRETCHGDCEIEADSAFDPQARAGSGWILVGNASDNRVWAAAASELPVDIGSSAVRLYDRQFSGDNLLLEAALPRPGAPAARLVLVGCSDPSGATLPDCCLPTDGWFTAALWRREGGAAEPVFADLW